MRPPRLYKGYKAIKGLERPGGGPIERYLRVLHKALEGLIRPFRLFEALSKAILGLFWGSFGKAFWKVCWKGF